MALATGSRLGSYEILAPLGAGGMGEVYRARDAKLNRDVAIKVLPELFSADPDRLARFRREAQVLASLNHQNIGHIYGLEDSAGVHALVLELVEGPTLADRIARGPVPLDDAIPIARQIADALECAHEQGIVHRDLKPANVKLRPDGTVKVLDFGLAKAFDPAAASSPDAMNSPTLTARGTQLGIIVGTAAYMAPEQARGKPVDRRADIWAFGVVLYEMLTGNRAFAGDDVSITLAAVLKDDVDWKALPEDLPESVARVLRRCLEKDPRRRLSAIADARLELEFPLAETRRRETSPAAAGGWRRLLPWTVAAAALLAFLATLLAWAPWRAPQSKSQTTVRIDPGAPAPVSPNFGGALALTPDGRTLAFIALDGGRRHLFVRRLHELNATRLPGTEDAAAPFFSPDGQSLGFFTPTHLKRIALAGGTPINICAIAAGPTAARGGTWGDDGTIVFQPTTAAGAKLMRVADTGGTPAPLVTSATDDGTQRWPQLLPGGHAVLYGANARPQTWDSANVMVHSLSSGSPRILVEGGYYPRYVASGHLLYLLRGTLYAAPFDVERLELTGRAVQIVDDVAGNTVTGGANFAMSPDGTLAYISGKGIDLTTPIALVDESGKSRLLVEKALEWQMPRFSPTGDRIALMATTDGVSHIYVYDFARQRLDQLTFEDGPKGAPVWTPDGTRIVYTNATDGGAPNLYWRRADGTGKVERLTTSTNSQVAYSFHPQGRYLAYTERGAGGLDLMVLPLEGDEKTGWKPGTPRVFLKTTDSENYPMFSPDGRWIAYMSDAGGTGGIYVRAFEGDGGPWQVSTGGGLYPRWSRRGEILYVPSSDSGTVMATTYTVEGNSFRPGKSRVWTTARIRAQGPGRTLDLHPDGTRIVTGITSPDDSGARHIVFVFNFVETLRRLTTATPR